MISDYKKQNSTVSPPSLLPEEARRTLDIDFFHQEKELSPTFSWTW